MFLNDNFLPSFVDSKYILFDDFTVNLAAGSVNNSSAVPVGGIRTVSDTNGKLSINSGNAVFATGGVGQGNPAIWYEPIRRLGGRMCFGKTTGNGTAGGVYIGFDNDTSGQQSDSLLIRVGNNTILAITNNAAGRNVGTSTPNTIYKTCVITRGSGAFYFIKGGTYPTWTLLFADVAGSVNPLYPSIGQSSDTNTAMNIDYIMVPNFQWVPAPIISDGFSTAFISDGLGHPETIGLGVGGAGIIWVMSSLTWTISSGKLLNTPSVGADIISNGGFASDTVWSKGAGWTISGGVATATTASAGSNLVQSVATIGVWYQTTFSITAYTSGSINSRYGTGTQIGPSRSAVGTFTDTNRQISTTESGIRVASGATTLSVDNFVVKPLNISELFHSFTSSTIDIMASTEITNYNTGSQAGQVICLDSKTSPANFIIIYLDNNVIKVDKCVSGIYTNLATNAFTYSANGVLRVHTRIDFTTLKVRVYYNSVLVGSEVAVADAFIISNTIHGLFSTMSNNQFDNYNVYSVGMNNEYDWFDDIAI